VSPLVESPDPVRALEILYALEIEGARLDVAQRLGPQWEIAFRSGGSVGLRAAALQYAQRSLARAKAVPVGY